MYRNEGNKAAPPVPKYSKEGAGGKGDVGPRRAQVCLGCLKSAIGSKSDGACHDAVGKGTRCARCAKGKPCNEIPADVVPFANIYLAMWQCVWFETSVVSARGGCRSCFGVRTTDTDGSQSAK